MELDYELPIEGDFTDSDLQASFEADFDDDFLTGDVNIEDVNDWATGAPKPARMARAVAKKMKKKAKTAEQKSAASAAASLPGVALMGATLPPIIDLSGAVIKHPGTVRKLSGNLLKWNIDCNPVLNPFLSVTKFSAGQQDPNQPTTISFADADKPAGCAIFSAPILFISLSTSQLNARLGNRYELSVTGYTRDGVAITSDKWLIERETGNVAVRFAYIPYVRQNDTIVPVAAAFGDVGGTNQNVVLTITMKGVSADEFMQVIIPGLDSIDYEKFLQNWGLSIIK